MIANRYMLTPQTLLPVRSDSTKLAKPNRKNVEYVLVPRSVKGGKTYKEPVISIRVTPIFCLSGSFSG